MPGGSDEAYASLGPLLETIAAQVDGTPCCTHVGPDGAGHFVKMVHNGIEYSDMQLIAESYDLLRQALGATPGELAAVFRDWNQGELESYLIGITAEVLEHVDGATGRPFVDIVLDAAEQKGTGRWGVQSALDLGVPAWPRPCSRARCPHTPPSAGRRRPCRARVPQAAAGVARDTLVEDVQRFLYAPKIVAYAQGFDQIAAGSDEYRWGIDLGAMATIWRGGCIIRARFLIASATGTTRIPAWRCCSRRRSSRRWRTRRTSATRRGHRRLARGADTRLLVGSRLLRRVATRAAAGGPGPGTARPVRGPHISSGGPQRDIPHSVARGSVRGSGGALGARLREVPASVPGGRTSAARTRRPRRWRQAPT